MKNIRRDYKGLEMVIQGQQPILEPNVLDRLSKRVYRKLKLALPSYMFDADDLEYEYLAQDFLCYLIENIPVCISAVNSFQSIRESAQTSEKIKEIRHLVYDLLLDIRIHNDIILGWDFWENDYNFANTLVSACDSAKEYWWPELYFEAERNLKQTTETWRECLFKSLHDTNLPEIVIEQMVSLLAPFAADCQLYIDYIDELLGTRTISRIITLFCGIYELIINTNLTCFRLDRTQYIFDSYIKRKYNRIK